jgi:hypothetical protein
MNTLIDEMADALKPFLAVELLNVPNYPDAAFAIALVRLMRARPMGFPSPVCEAFLASSIPTSKIKRRLLEGFYYDDELCEQ